MIGLQRLLGFLMEDCCDGRPEVCAPLATMVESVSGCGTRRPAPVGGRPA